MNIGHLISAPILQVNPVHAAILHRAGLRLPADFLGLAGDIIGGHPDRYVSRVQIRAGKTIVDAFLKREHRAIYKERLVNWWLGFGPVAKSLREAIILRRAQAAGIGCADWLAAGQDSTGQAFILLLQFPGAVELREYLSELNGEKRARFCRRLGQELAKIHGAGLCHPDLCAKHILINSDDGSICFLDWQRARIVLKPLLAQCCRDLATIDATLNEVYVSERDRLRVLKAYLRARDCQSKSLGTVAQRIRRYSIHLLERRRICRARHMSATPNPVTVRWLDADSLCVSTRFAERTTDDKLRWLREQLAMPLEETLLRRHFELPDLGSVLLIRRRSTSFPAFLKWLQRSPVVTPEVRRAGEALRREQAGIAGERALAFGQRQLSPWRFESFLLVKSAHREEQAIHHAVLEGAAA
jgi:tRNA A-37 threonylcarbamoyl transferase component Bud32